MTSQTSSPQNMPPSRARLRLREATWSCTLIYFILVCTFSLILWTTADRWWLGTVIMYAARWPSALPLAILIPAAILVCRKALWVLAITAIVLVVPVLGVCVPWRTTFDGRTDARSLRVMTWNIHDRGADREAFVRLVEESQPDIIALQSWANWHNLGIFDIEYRHTLQEDQFLIASRFPIQRVDGIHGEGFDGHDGGAAHYIIDTPSGRVDLFNVHLATPREGLEALRSRNQECPRIVAENSEVRRAQSRTLGEALKKVDRHVLIVGDFNLCIESSIYRDYWGEYEDAFSRAGWGMGDTFYHRWTEVRIDHVLTGNGWRCRRAWVGPNLGSAHRPLIADLEYRGE
jgi:vancomycin resistance protein VanJ